MRSAFPERMDLRCPIEPFTVKKPHARACKGAAKDDEKTGEKRYDVQPFPLYTLRHTCLTR